MVTAVTVLDTGLIEKPDQEQLAFATECGCVLYTFNVSDFYRLHTEWVGAGRERAGMILAPQQRFSVGEQLRRILHLRATTTAAAMRNQVDFLSNWGWQLIRLVPRARRESESSRTTRQPRLAGLPNCGCQSRTGSPGRFEPTTLSVHNDLLYGKTQNCGTP
jgi:hypothetical protein